MIQVYRSPRCSAHAMASTCLQTTSEGGWVKVADKSNFAVSSHMSGALVHLVPGGMRELHW